MKTYYDAECLKAIEDAPNTSVAWWLMASYQYYIKDDPILSDGVYDAISNYITDNWGRITHRHKSLLLSPEVCRSSGHHLNAEDYPQIAVHAVKTLRGT